MGSVTKDAEGVTISETIDERNFTLRFDCKVSDGNYGAQEIGLIGNVKFAPDADLVDIETGLKAQATFMKTFVLDQLGVDSEEVDGVVRAKPAAPAVKATSKSSGGGSRPSGGAKSSGDKPDYDAMWQDYVDNPNNWWDNRADKEAGVTADGQSVNPKSPDFKGKKNSRFANKGLWINDKTPAFAKLVLDGEAF